MLLLVKLWIHLRKFVAKKKKLCSFEHRFKAVMVYWLKRVLHAKLCLLFVVDDEWGSHKKAHFFFTFHFLSFFLSLLINGWYRFPLSPYGWQFVISLFASVRTKKILKIYIFWLFTTRELFFTIIVYLCIYLFSLFIHTPISFFFFFFSSVARFIPSSLCHLNHDMWQFKFSHEPIFVENHQLSLEMFSNNC